MTVQLPRGADLLGVRASVASERGVPGKTAAVPFE